MPLGVKFVELTQHIEMPVSFVGSLDILLKVRLHFDMQSVDVDELEYTFRCNCETEQIFTEEFELLHSRSQLHW